MVSVVSWQIETWRTRRFTRPSVSWVGLLSLMPVSTCPALPKFVLLHQQCFSARGSWARRHAISDGNPGPGPAPRFHISFAMSVRLVNQTLSWMPLSALTWNNENKHNNCKNHNNQSFGSSPSQPQTQRVLRFCSSETSCRYGTAPAMAAMSYLARHCPASCRCSGDSTSRGGDGDNEAYTVAYKDDSLSTAIYREGPLYPPPSFHCMNQPGNSVIFGTPLKSFYNLISGRNQFIIWRIFCCGNPQCEFL